jgi:hypothetical protein
MLEHTSVLGLLLATIIISIFVTSSFQEDFIRVENFYPPDGFQPVQGFEPENYVPYQKIHSQLNENEKSSSQNYNNQNDLNLDTISSNRNLNPNQYDQYENNQYKSFNDGYLSPVGPIEDNNQQFIPPPLPPHQANQYGYKEQVNSNSDNFRVYDQSNYGYENLNYQPNNQPINHPEMNYNYNNNNFEASNNFPSNIHQKLSNGEQQQQGWRRTPPPNKCN